MPVPTSALAAAVGLTGGSGLLAAAAETAGQTDLAGIALIITALAGLVSSVGAVLIGLRRRPPSDPATELALELLRKQLERADDEQP